MDLRATIDKAIDLIEKKEFEILTETLLEPEELKTLTGGDPELLEALARQLTVGGGEELLLKALQYARSDKAQFRVEEGGIIIQLPSENDMGELRFVKIGERWYLKDQTD